MSKNKGFTLIELLVVIAIIALLMAILMPSLQRVKKQAKAVVCQSNLHQWGLYFSFYTDDNNGRFHKGWNAGPDRDYSWMVVFRPYYRDDPDLKFCPMATKLRGEGGIGSFAAWNIDFTTADEYEQKYWRGSYGINIWVTDPMPGREGGMPGEWYWRRCGVKRTNLIPVFFGDLWWDTRPHHTDQPPEYEGQADGWSTNAMKMLCLNRHNANTNSLFLDFSVRRVGLKELWRLKWNRNYDLNAPLPQWPDWMKIFPDP